MPTIALASAARTEPPGSSGILPPFARTRCSPAPSIGRGCSLMALIVAESRWPPPVEDLLDALGVLPELPQRTERAGVVGEARERGDRVLVQRMRLDADDLERLVGAHRRAVRPLGRERLLDVGDREQADRPGPPPRGQAPQGGPPG